MRRRAFLKGAGAAAAAVTWPPRPLRETEGTIERRKLKNRDGVSISDSLPSERNPEEESQAPDRMIKAGYESGINFFDVYDHSGYKQFEPWAKASKGSGRT